MPRDDPPIPGRPAAASSAAAAPLLRHGPRPARDGAGRDRDTNKPPMPANIHFGTFRDISGRFGTFLWDLP